MITKQDLETRRQADAMLSWVEGRIERIGATREGKRSIWFREGLVKRLVEEALPIAIFARRHFAASPLVTIELVLGSQSYDAVVHDGRDPPGNLQYLEVTQAHEGENEHLRMCVLEATGSVNLLGRVLKKGTKKTGRAIGVVNEARHHADVRQEQLERIRDAALRKAKKRCPRNTALVIAFDDQLAVRSEEDLQALDGFARVEVAPLLNNYRLLALVGWGKRGHLEYRR